MFSNYESGWGRLTGWMVLAGLLLGAAAGCGGGNPFDMVRVTGKVTYEDGTLIPAARLEVRFNPLAKPIDKKTYPKLGAAEVNTTDGTFSGTTTWKYNDGVVAGPHKVTVIGYDEQGNRSGAVPEIYRNPHTTPQEVEVSRRSRHFEFKLPKPS